MSPYPNHQIDGDQTHILKKDFEINEFIYDLSLMMNNINKIIMEYGKISAQINKEKLKDIKSQILNDDGLQNYMSNNNKLD